MEHFIITGTSRGIGGQTARLLLEKGHHVHGIARGNAEELEAFPHYAHYHCDLSDSSGLRSLMRGILQTIDRQQATMLCLVLNAAMLEPLRFIEHCGDEELQRHVHTSLLAPMILTSSFAELTEGFPMRRKLIYLSSGSGRYAAPGMSAYCTAKAGINMFASCVSLEQSKRDQGIEIVVVDPGMAETAMQASAREKDKDAFPMAAYFQEAHSEGQLQSAEAVGAYLVQVIAYRHESGAFLQFPNIEGAERLGGEI
ncbi:SDR family NAD(P)-dependent oxidoreductase [Paenibacillus sp. HB172176]|uniref:SDR family NAD(P)-dependent oxidoreductase n=1 Tax=Paenibacillus sp. HB172176 TaxID=2493690 RepID=UPI00143B9140|nr:SDR family NAD(P)-dependent oxidoreductase [Paenibacillus sp. HB172176]